MVKQAAHNSSDECSNHSGLIKKKIAVCYGVFNFRHAIYIYLNNPSAGIVDRILCILLLRTRRGRVWGQSEAKAPALCVCVCIILWFEYGKDVI